LLFAGERADDQERAGKDRDHPLDQALLPLSGADVLGPMSVT
jgi:hypothetical protein